jgi:SAM-dependent methyltransferase
VEAEAERRRLGATFDEVAALYDEVRPRYPEALVERVLEVSAIGPDGRILEIGAGPGNATLPFARRGYAMLCLEPGRALAVRCRSHCAGFPRVRVLERTFEAWPLERGAFDLVIAAQSLHWTDPATAYGRVADALRPGGWLASFWNRPEPPETPSPIDRAIAEAYLEHAPDLLDRDHHEGRRPATWKVFGQPSGHGLPEDRIAESGRFEAVRREMFPWSERYEAERYGKLLRTHSHHRALPAARLERLVEAVTSAVRRHGGVHVVRYQSVLYLAQRKRELA